ncbi:MAG: protoheme IX farnesyltransferase, partial [Thermoplasmata archaeon]
MKLRIDALLLLVAAAGYVATSGPRINPVSFGLLMVTGLLAASGASATNHYLDRDVDAIMRRTSGRPLPMHRIEPAARALGFGIGLTAISLGVAYLWINPLTAAMIGLGYAVYVGVYTLGLKRTHVSNIVIGGFAGSCPALAGSAAAVNAISLPAALIALL